jgi:hypothetical protein
MEDAVRVEAMTMAGENPNIDQVCSGREVLLIPDSA